MIVAGSANPLLLASAGGYNLTNSLRFRQSASAYLSRTPSVAGSRRTWTYSTWVKRGTLGATFQSLFAASNGSTVQFYFGFSNDQLTALNWAGSTQMQLNTTAVYRDPSAWYHIVMAVDTTQATDTNRVKFYVNGTQITAFGTASYPAQNLDIAINALVPHAIGREEYSDNQWFDGYLAETHFIDGQQLTPSSFGSTSATTGVWQPKKYAGTYGTNGFYLPFTDNSALTTSSNVGLGKDFSGNGNYWTTNNISITSGSTYDSMTDVPTLTSATTANYCTLNPLWYTSSGAGTLSNANLTFTQGSSGQFGETFSTMVFPPIGTAGKYYFEFVFTNGLLSDVNQGGGVYNSTSFSDYAIVQPKSSSTVFNRSGSTTSSGTGYSFGDVLQVAIDTGSGKIWYGKNNTWYSGNPATDTSPTYSNLTSGASYVAGFTSYSYSVTGQVNFGQRPFAYTPPTGFVRLNTFNLPTPTIGATASTQANKYFDATLYTGTGSSNAVVNAGGFQPDFVWIKSRSNAYPHFLYDAIRTAGKYLASNSTDAEVTTTQMTSFNSNGFTVNNDGGSVGTNNNGSTFVGWQWNAGGSTVTNNSGSISSQVRANTSSGFSVATYTGNGSTGATVGHGLGVAPSMVIVKKRSSTGNWITYHIATGVNKYLYLNATNGEFTATPTWGVSSTTVTLQQAFGDYNDNGVTYVMYSFSEIAGYSKFGSYTGNGSTDGTFIYTGFKPAFFMCKSSSSGTNGWEILDNERLTYNGSGSGLYLYANNSGAENQYGTGSSGTEGDFTSNGVKLRSSGSINSSGVTYIYMAFAENPFKYSLAR